MSKKNGFIGIDIGALKECILGNRIQIIIWINSIGQLVDVSTKQGANPYVLYPYVLKNGCLWWPIIRLTWGQSTPMIVL